MSLLPGHTTELYAGLAIARIDSIKNGVIRVYWQSTTWFAQVYADDANLSFYPGQLVKVLGREGLTLFITKI